MDKLKKIVIGGWTRGAALTLEELDDSHRSRAVVLNLTWIREVRWVRVGVMVRFERGQKVLHDGHIRISKIIIEWQGPLHLRRHIIILYILPTVIFVMLESTGLFIGTVESVEYLVWFVADFASP